MGFKGFKFLRDYIPFFKEFTSVPLISLTKFVVPNYYLGLFIYKLEWVSAYAPGMSLLTNELVYLYKLGFTHYLGFDLSILPNSYG